MQTPLSSRLVYEGRIFDVTVDRVALPHGREADLEVVRHDGSVVLLPIADDGRLLLVRQYRYAADRFLWELPAGSLEVGEDRDAAAARECQEELGLIAEGLRAPAHALPHPGVLHGDDDVLPGDRAPAAGPGRPTRASGRGRVDRSRRLQRRADSHDDRVRRDRGPEDGRGAQLSVRARAAPHQAPSTRHPAPHLAPGTRHFGTFPSASSAAPASASARWCCRSTPASAPRRWTRRGGSSCPSAARGSGPR